MKLIVQIPCYNEEQTLASVLASIPRQMDGVDRIETLVIDDGCTDQTVAIARQLGVDHIVVLPGHKGLAAAFGAGIDRALAVGADIIVNTDGDNQYPQEQIGLLVGPILQNQADMVIGDRQTSRVRHFSLIKRILQQLGSWVVRRASGTPVPDATCGFRAFSREMALRLVVMSGYSYTLETIIQAGKKGMRIASAPIECRPPTRPSRLFNSTWRFIVRQAVTVLRLYVFYEPLRTFCYIAAPFVLIGTGAVVRFLYLNFTHQSGFGRHVQSLVLGGTLLVIGFVLLVLGVLAELIAASRLQIEETLYRTKRLELASRGDSRPDVGRVEH
jgi:glycosyltransferase involved in cell wall biosynthesis